MSLQPDTPLLEELAGFMSGTGIPRAVRASGGSIASAWRLRQGDSEAFLKLMSSDTGVLEAEAAGLTELERAGAVRVPAVLASGSDDGRDWLLLEYLPLEAPSAGAWAAFGRALAVQHGVTADRHGWYQDNFIGATPQPNPRQTDWRVFYRDARLGHQLRLARERGLDGATVRQVEAVMASLGELLPDAPEPSLLHGDLWSGNIAAMGDTPVIYDPAVYYGDADADLAMMELFGAPPPEFWSSYEQQRPLAPGYQLRRDLYNLYHLLNHYNLFGGGFAGQARRSCDRLLAEAGP
jgi:fructosamine-3-kinase